MLQCYQLYALWMNLCCFNCINNGVSTWLDSSSQGIWFQWKWWRTKTSRCAVVTIKPNKIWLYAQCAAEQLSGEIGFIMLTDGSCELMAQADAKKAKWEIIAPQLSLLVSGIDWFKAALRNFSWLIINCWTKPECFFAFCSLFGKHKVQLECWYKNMRIWYSKKTKNNLSAYPSSVFLTFISHFKAAKEWLNPSRLYTSQRSEQFHTDGSHIKGFCYTGYRIQNVCVYCEKLHTWFTFSVRNRENVIFRNTVHVVKGDGWGPLFSGFSPLFF